MSKLKMYLRVLINKNDNYKIFCPSLYTQFNTVVSIRFVSIKKTNKKLK